MSAPRRETDIARPVVEYLRDLHWDVHQEVSIGSRADIVAQQGSVLWVIETKVALSLDVIAQAMNWLDHAHYVSVAVPHSRQAGRARWLAYKICAQHGIGVLEVDTRHRELTVGTIREEKRARFQRQRLIPAFVERLRGALCEQTRVGLPAGSAGGGYWTPFKATCEEIRRAIKIHGPLTTRDLVERITHHYASAASARSTLPKWLAAGKIPGVTALPGRPLRWALTDTNTRGAA